MGMKNLDLKEGDSVTVLRDGVPVAIRTVSRVMKRFVELSNGTKFGLDGNEYPRPSGYHYHFTEIQKTTDEHVAALQKAEILKDLQEALDVVSRAISNRKITASNEDIVAVTEALKKLTV